MSTQVLLAYGAQQVITLTQASLANSAARQSALVDNSSNKYIDYLVEWEFKLNASGVNTSAGHLDLYVGYSIDGGSTYIGGLTGSDASYSIPTLPQLVLVATAGGGNLANSLQATLGAFSIASLIGFCPQKFAFVIQNFTGAALDATAGNFSLSVQGMNAQLV